MSDFKNGLKDFQNMIMNFIFFQSILSAVHQNNNLSQ